MTPLLPALLYASIAVFLAGMSWRLSVWLRAPVPLNIVLTPGPATTAGVARRLAGEALFFHSLFAADRWLWVAAWLFHLSLALLAVGHIAGLVIPELARVSLGLTEQGFHQLAQVTGGVFGVVAVVPLLMLLLRRLTMERLRYVSTFSDYFALVLLLLVIVTGNRMRFMGVFDLAHARQFVSGVLTFHPVAPPSDAAFVAHLLLVCALLVYIPFSKLVHFGGLVFNPILNQKNDPRDQRHVGPWDRLQNASARISSQGPPA
jgi:respiratory nitrate reductase gamma subunit